MLNELIGAWKTDPNDAATQHEYGDVTMEFKENGELIYTIKEGVKEHKMFMTYEIVGNFLVTDQPSHPNKEKTGFTLSKGRLELSLGGIKSVYVRC